MFSGSKSCPKGFTLIEILIVIGIIALLVAILFPIFARARENARRAGCQANLKQLSLGVFQYMQDFDETYPLVCNDANSAGVFKTGFPWGESNQFNWTDRIMPYVKNTESFHCPSIARGYPGPAKNYSHYGINIYLTRYCNRDLSGTDQYSTFRTAAVNNSSTKVLLTDYRVGNGTITNVVGAWGLGTNYTYAMNYTAFPAVAGNIPSCNVSTSCLLAPVDGRHLGGANVAFLDGHVKWLKIGTDASGTDTDCAWGTLGDYPASNDFRTNWGNAVNATAATYWAPHR